MADDSIGDRLKKWRRANGIKQNTLAEMLGVSQAAVSRWENSIDNPSLKLISKLADMFAAGVSADLVADRLFIEQLGSVEAIFDIDGIRLRATSGGMRRLWPIFSHMQAREFESRMIGESRLIIDNRELRKSVLLGEVPLICGVSDRHLDLPGDAGVRHRWTARIRRYGDRVLTHMVYEPCDIITPLGVTNIISVDDLLALR